MSHGGMPTLREQPRYHIGFINDARAIAAARRRLRQSPDQGGGRVKPVHSSFKLHRIDILHWLLPSPISTAMKYCRIVSDTPHEGRILVMLCTGSTLPSVAGDGRVRGRLVNGPEAHVFALLCPDAYTKEENHLSTVNCGFRTAARGIYSPWPNQIKFGTQTSGHGVILRRLT